MLLLQRVMHYIRVRPRLLVSVLLGVLVFFVLPESHSLLSRALIGWNAQAWSYLLFLWVLILRADQERVRVVARMQDESAAVVLSLVTLASLVSLLAILFELAIAKQLTGVAKSMHLLLTGATLVGSWLLLPTAFAIHYAHLFYGHHHADNPALQFPDKIAAPTYWDFAYFSFTIGVASQTADVAIGSARVRRVVLLQSILSFIFNMSILGLSINVAAGLMG